jgi:hypothetical protein
VVTVKSQRLSPADTRRVFDSYTLYRFGHVLSPAEFAKQAGVEERTVSNLFAQQQIPEADLTRIARAVDVSPRLVSEIAGYQDMDGDTRTSLDRFLGAARQLPKRRKAA